MSSSSISPEPSPPPPKAATTPLEFTVAVKNKRGQLVTPDLGDVEKHALKGAIEAIRQAGLQSSATNWGVFNEEGAVVTMTSEGLFVQRAGERRNLLSDATVDKNLRSTVRKTFSTATSVIGKKEDVVIHVKVVPSVELFAKRCDEEERFCKRLAEVKKELQGPEKQDYLNHLESLEKASKEILEVMQRVRDLLRQDKPEEAIQLYNAEMAIRYAQFSDAMRVWRRDQQFLKKHLVNLDHAGFQASVANELQTFALKRNLPPVEVTFQKIVKSWQSYEKELELAQKIKDKVSEATQKERDFNRKVASSVARFEASDFTTQLKNGGWSDAEIQDYKAKLSHLKTQSDDFLKRLAIADQKLASGYIQEGMDQLSADMDQSYQGYLQAWIDLVIPQKVALGRSFSVRDPALDLKSPVSDYPFLLEEIYEWTMQAEVVNAEGNLAIVPGKWRTTAEATQKQLEALDEAQHYLEMTHGLNYNHHLNREFASRMLLFVDAYTNHRELFEMTMREQGISDLQSAFIFNHYTAVKDALVEWNQRFQKVVDLANRKQYADALIEYGKLVEELYPQLHGKIRNVFFSVGFLRRAPVQKAFREFASLVGIPAEKSLTELSTERAGPRQLLILDECIEKAKKQRLAIPQELVKARKTIDGILKGDDANVEEFSRLFTLVDILNPNISRDEKLEQQWQGILQSRGWTEEKRRSFMGVLSRYCHLTRHLKQAEQAIATESNPQKKRALQTQLKVLAEELRPELDRLKQEWRQIKGDESLHSLTRSVKEFVMSNDYTHFLLNSLYHAVEAENKERGFEDSHALLEGLENYILQLPEEERAAARRFYARELDAIHQIKAVNTFQLELLDFVNQPAMRTEYIDGLYRRLGLSSVEKGVIAHNLLQGPHARDPLYFENLRQQGWTKESVEKLSHWFDRYRAEMIPLEQAKKALDEDRENILLQQEYKKVALQRIPRLNKLAEEFAATFKTKERIRDLEIGLARYGNRLVTELDQKRLEAKQFHLPVTRQESLQQQIQDIEQSLKMIQAVQIGDELDRMEALLRESTRTAILPMSGDKEFLNLLLPDKYSPLMLIKPGGKEPLWPKLLGELKSEEIKTILKLQRSYQQEMAKLIELERKLEANPGDTKLLNALFKELKERREALIGLRKKHQAMNSKIASLQEALQSFRLHLEKGVEKLKLGDAMMKEGQVTEEGLRLMRPQRTFEKKQIFGDLSDSQIERLIRLSGELNISESFAERNRFIEETYRRFSI